MSELDDISYLGIRERDDTQHVFLLLSDSYAPDMERKLVARGHGVISIPLRPELSVPKMAHRVVRVLQVAIAKFPSLHKIYIMGQGDKSGCIAALLCTNESYFDILTMSLFSVQGCITFDPVTNDHRLTGPINRFVGREYSTFVHCFPIYNVNPRCPPFFIVSSGVNEGHVTDLVATLLDRGVYYELNYSDDASDAEPIWNKMDAFCTNAWDARVARRDATIDAL